LQNGVKVASDHEQPCKWKSGLFQELRIHLPNMVISNKQVDRFSTWRFSRFGDAVHKKFSKKFFRGGGMGESAKKLPKKATFLTKLPS
jgi:hypothetical protein